MTTLRKLADQFGTEPLSLVSFVLSGPDTGNALLDTPLVMHTEIMIKEAWELAQATEPVTTDEGPADASPYGDPDPGAAAGHHHAAGETCDPPAEDVSGR